MQIDDKVSNDIKHNKVKQGFLQKRSRILREWKNRWLVLTKNYLYSFVEKGVYNKPTEKICLKDVTTIKSYYKKQFEKPQIIRLETQDSFFYLSSKDHQQKWAWMTAIEKMTDRLQGPQHVNDNQNLIRQTIRMSSAVRQSMIKKQQFVLPFSKQFNVMKNIKICIDHAILNLMIVPTLKQEQELMEQQCDMIKSIVNQTKQTSKVKDFAKTNNSQILDLFEASLLCKTENPRPVMQYLIFLLLKGPEKYNQNVLQFCVNSSNQRYFAQMLLLLLNEEIDESKQNEYINFITLIYQNNYQYFYSSDVKILIDILLRQIEFNRSEFNQYLIINLLKVLSSKQWWQTSQHRRSDIINILEQIKNISTPENQQLANQLLLRM